ncbi:fam-e protein [Plasmodium gallinaceum]|uniref:Fam-e protein n=1 Tax=Plasmodium gallinaceum TaxID=5849 RepID=A0A1J1GTZ1_PLAGA|nr:fam-e protein [Plasmodium gallinaceum]CRG94512.1 fam-e protein [Plasmodium gallinaceum]
MSLLYNEGCEDSGDFTKCLMSLCSINPNKLQSSYCIRAPEFVITQRPFNNVLINISKNIFTYEHYGPDYESSITILSNEDKDGILILYEYNPLYFKYPKETYLCRLRNKNQKISLCESINVNYIGKSISFNSYDIINRDDKKNNLISMKHLENPKHRIIKLKYNEIILKKDSCHHAKTKYNPHHTCRYIICEKDDHGNTMCANSNYNGKLIHLLDYYTFANLKEERIVYLPNKCLKSDSNLLCTPYMCIKNNLNESYSCEYEEISIVKNIFPSPETFKAISTNHQAIYHESNLRSSSVYAMTLMPFLIIFIFFFCYIYKIFRKKRRKIN